MKRDRQLTKLVREMLTILNTVESTDEGRDFHPTRITSCRTNELMRLQVIMSKLEKLTKKG